MVESSSKRRASSSVAAASGALSGVLAGACLQPLDVVRTMMQADSARGVSRGARSAAVAIYSAHGLSGFWRGTAPSVMRMGLGVGLHMVLVENVAAALSARMDSNASPLKDFLTGGISRAMVSTLNCPLTVVKTRMEYSASDAALKYKHVLNALTTIAKTEGTAGLFRGLVPTVLTNAPFSGLYYMFYSRLQRCLAADGRPTMLINFGSGAIAAAAATVVTQPLDVVRTRMQLSVRPGSGSAAAAGGTLETLAAALKQGPQALLVGALPRFLKRISQTALVWALYEELVPCLTAARSNM